MLKHIKHWHVRVGVRGDRPFSLTAHQYYENARTELADELRRSCARGVRYYR